jgi:hypothetical protein
MLALAVNVALLLIALAFASLLSHSLTLARNPDLTLKELATNEQQEAVTPKAAIAVAPEATPDEVVLVESVEPVDEEGE